MNFLRKNSWVWVAIVVALLGFADAAYLANEHLRGAIPPCTIGGCEQVLTSVYAEVFGVPVALLGAGYYLFVAALLVWSVSERKHSGIRLAMWVVTAGMAATLYFVGLQLFVLHAICVYCMGSAASTTTLFVLLWSMRSRPLV